MMSLNKP